jgi:hypothetical protein
MDQHEYEPSRYPDGSSTCVHVERGRVCDYVRDHPMHGDYSSTPHKYIKDTLYTIDTSGESCITCGLGEGSKVHDKYRPRNHWSDLDK